MRTINLSCLFLMGSFFFSQLCGISYGDESVQTGPESLIHKHRAIEEGPSSYSSSVPFFIESAVSKKASRVDIYGTMEYPFETVQKEFLAPTNWCEILLPHVSVRACTYKKVNNNWLLNIYNVNEFSEPLEDAYEMKFEYRVSELQPRYFDILLTAHEGPFHTKNHQFELEAIPLHEGRTFVHLRYSFGYSSWRYFLMKYFGGSKTGFSVTGTDSDGNPVYVSGLRGSVERTVVCYYIAIMAYMDALDIPAEHRYEKQINRWYDLASRLKKQLIETEKEEYFTSKRQDRKNQLMLQGDLKK